MSFGYLDRYDVSAKTAKITLESLPGVGGEHPVLEVRFAGRGNPGYKNARAKAAWSSGEDRELVDKLDAEIKAEILAAHVLTGWEFMAEDDPDNAGCIRLSTFSVEKATEFLKGLAAKMPSTLEVIWQISQRESFFLNGVEPPKVAAEDLGKK